MAKELIIGTRGSKLALWQANYIAKELKGQNPGLEVTLKHIVTTGDKIVDVPLAKVGGKGLFTKELEQAMLAKQIDIAVHSLKDMPVELPEGVTLAAITKRVHPGDALVSLRYNSLAEVPFNARIGTSSLRRAAQLLNYRPDVSIVNLRGNIDTRLRKLESENLDGIVLAVAGLQRLGLEAYISEVIPKEVCLPAVGQGVLAIEARADDFSVKTLLKGLHHEDTFAAITAERAFLRMIEGGCQVPVGVFGDLQEDQLHLEAAIFSLDGKHFIKDFLVGKRENAEELGNVLASSMLDAGGKDLLQEIIK